MYDGQKVIHLGDDLDDYGCVGPEFVVYKEFNPFHWDMRTIHVNDILCPGKGTSAGWHGGEMPSVYVDTAAIRKAKNCQIKFEGETYKIPEELYEYVKESEGIPEPECFAYVLDEDGDCDGYVGFV